MKAIADSSVRTSRRAYSARPFGCEQDLYEPVKRFLEELGYEVNGEVRGCDVVAVRRAADAAGEAEPPVVVELKLNFSLGFVLQGVDRLAVTHFVYLAAPAAIARPGSSRRAPHCPTHPGVRRLCRRLGLGLLAVHPARNDGAGRVEVICDPCPPAGLRLPRRNKARAALLLGEHARRRGDPNRGGTTGGKPLLTACWQEALRCAAILQSQHGGPLPVALLRQQAEAPNAARIPYRNVYGWFEPAGRGLCRLTEEGVRGLGGSRASTSGRRGLRWFHDQRFHPPGCGRRRTARAGGRGRPGRAGDLPQPGTQHYGCETTQPLGGGPAPTTRGMARSLDSCGSSAKMAAPAIRRGSTPWRLRA